jgi:hypothetical protein
LHHPRPPHQHERFNPFRVDDISGLFPSVADSIGNAGLNDFYPVGIDEMEDLIYE